MKKLTVTIVLCLIGTYQTQTETMLPCQTIAQARQYFINMSVKEMNKLNLHDLTPEQLQAFKQLSTELFHSDVACASSTSQVNRFKAEIMYQKIGALFEQY